MEQDRELSFDGLTALENLSKELFKKIDLLDSNVGESLEDIDSLLGSDSVEVSANVS